MRPRTFKEMLRRALISVPRFVLMGIFFFIWLMVIVPASVSLWYINVPYEWMGGYFPLYLIIGAAIIMIVIYMRLWDVYTTEATAWRNDAVALEKWAIQHGGKRNHYTATGVGQRGLVPYSLEGDHTVVWAITCRYRGMPAKVQAYRVATQGYETNDHRQQVAVGGIDFTVVTVLTKYRFPRTVARPHRIPRTWARAMRLPDLEVESEDFNKQWRLYGEDDRITHGLMSPQAIEKFLDPHMKHTIITFDRRAIRSVRRDFCLDVESTEAHLDALVALATNAGLVAEEY